MYENGRLNLGINIKMKDNSLNGSSETLQTWTQCLSMASQWPSGLTRKSFFMCHPYSLGGCCTTVWGWTGSGAVIGCAVIGGAATSGATLGLSLVKSILVIIFL